jgi:glyoxylase-like metal-dependent hydrolase (beta-lactamase superfamily II)
MKRFLLAAIFVVLPCCGFAAPSTPEYSIQAIRYASAEDTAADLVMGAPHEEMNLAMVILFDSGYHRDTFVKEFRATEYIRPDEAVKLAGIQPEDITDIVISHAHWDHMGGIDLFPKAPVWIQMEEFR